MIIELTPADFVHGLVENHTGAVYLDSSEIQAVKGSDDSFQIEFIGNLPNPCSQLKVMVEDSLGANKLNFLLFSTQPEDMVCAQVLAPIEQVVKINGLNPQEYEISINGEFKQVVQIPFK